jgi:hypothetical protein
MSRTWCRWKLQDVTAIHNSLENGSRMCWKNIEWVFLLLRTNFINKHGKKIWAATWQNQHSAFATSMDPDQPAHPRSPIRIHAVLLSVSQLVIWFVGEQHGSWSDCADAQAGLDPCWFANPLCWFCHDAAHIRMIKITGSIRMVEFDIYKVLNVLYLFWQFCSQFM